MNSEELKQIFQQKFDYHIFSRKIVHDLFGNNDVAKEPELLDTSAEGDQSYYIGRMTDADERELGFFYTHMAPGCDVRRKRVGLRKLISPYLKYDVDAAIAVFDDGQFWRLSYICDLQGSTTSAKRYSYVMGDVHGQYKTPVERLTKLQQRDITLSSIFDAFSVDALSDDFFKEYHQHYDMIVGSLAGHSFSATMHDYVKKMMGRIVFLHFLQKKGWLCGDPNFMQNTFLQSKRKDDYLESVLEPLFFGMLNTPPEDREQAFRDNGWDIKLLHQWQPTNHNSTLPTSHSKSKGIPYLNGGLFERDEIDQLTIKLPTWVFESLFNFLASYNFTVDENDPDDAEIGVDPEMLGKIFESLLEDNKAKGAFYTPKEIVWYMCREALIAYLDSKITDLDDSLNVSERHYPNNPAQENRRFSQCGAQGNGDDSVSETRHIHTDIRSFVEHHEFPDTLEPYREDLDRALREVKICDPAIGSGAFPMGLLNELWRCREALSISNGECEMGNCGKDGPISRLQLKREIIENNVYGVDIEKGAIDIARLRFWLSIVVDSEEPEPLPNFDYKFMQGNSLIESFEGVDLSKIFTAPKEGEQFALVFDGENEALELLKSSIQKYFRNSDHKQKAAMRATINEAVKTFIHCKSIDNQELHRRLEEIDCSANQEFFLWHIWFKDIFDKGGFDIVIGNPPYIQLQANEGLLANLYFPLKFSSFDRRGDIYELFYEKGNNILNTGGILCYITSNGWMKSQYGDKLRAYLANNTNPILLVDLNQMRLFENAIVETNILIFKKEQNQYQCKACSFLNQDKKEVLNNLTHSVDKESSICNFSATGSWTIGEQNEQLVKNKIEFRGILIAKWPTTIYRGITTGCNAGFIIDENVKETIYESASAEERILLDNTIFPILQGRNLKKYSYTYNNKYMIVTPKGYNINRAPALKAYMMTHYYELICKSGSNEWYELQASPSEKMLENMHKEKILWGEISDKAKFTFDDGQYFAEATTFMMTTDDKSVSLKYLLAILNSSLSEWYFHKIATTTGMGTNRWKKYKLEQLPVVKPTAEQSQQIAAIVDQILSTKKSNPNADTSSLEREIDSLVYELYGLTVEEIAIIEKGV